MFRISSLRYILMFIILVLLQVVILNSISFLSFAIPLVYIYFIIKLPIRLSQSAMLLLGFALGFAIDIFSNTPGINAAATTLLAMVRRPIMSIFFLTEDYAETEPAISTLGISTFVKYIILMLLVHIIALVVLESFSFFNIKLILLRVVCSTAISAVLILGFEGFSTSKQSNKTWRKV